MFTHVGLWDGILILMLTITFVQLLKKYSFALGLVDVPNHRSAHVNPTPRGAGIAIFMAYILVFLVFHFSFVQAHSGFL